MLSVSAGCSPKAKSSCLSRDLSANWHRNPLLLIYNSSHVIFWMNGDGLDIGVMVVVHSMNKQKSPGPTGSWLPTMWMLSAAPSLLQAWNIILHFSKSWFLESGSYVGIVTFRDFLAGCTLGWPRAKGHSLWGFCLFSACHDFFGCLSSA